MSEYKIVGVVFSTDGDLVDIVSTDFGFGIKDCFYNNDPFGIVCFSGFKNHEFVEVEKYIREEGKWIVNPDYEAECEVVKTGVLGACKGALFFKDGILLIQDTVFFKGVFQKKQSDDTYIEEKYVDFVDVSDEEDLVDAELLNALDLLI